MVTNVTKVKKYHLFALLFLFILNTNGLFAKPKDSNSNEKKSPEVYTKYVHPREYIFDLTDSHNKVVLKYDDVSKKAYCNVDFTNLVKEQMPRKGDKLTFVYEGTASYDISSITATIYDLTKGANLGNTNPESFAKNVIKNQPFKNEFSVVLTDHAEKSLSIRLIASISNVDKKTPKNINISFKRVTESTNIKKEMEAEKNAQKKGLKIVKVQSDFSEKKNIVEKEEVPVVVEEISEENSQEVNNNETLVLKQSTEVEQEEINIVQEDNISDEPAEVQITLLEENSTVQDEIIIDVSDDVQITQIEEETPIVTLIEDDEVSVIDEQISLDDTVSDDITTTEVAEITTSTTTVPLITTPSPKVSKYKKEYLQDYAVSEDYEVEEELPEVRIISNPNEQDKNGKTQLMDAVKKGDKELIKDLINSGADISLQDKEGWTALMYCARYQKDLACLDLLLEANADVKTKNKYGLSSLVFAATYNTNPKILHKLLSYYAPADKEVLKAFSLLLSECSNKENIIISKARIFIEYEIPINAFYNGKTPLMYVTKNSSSTKLINLLLENNAIVTLRSTEGKTAFDYAKTNTRLEHDSVYWSLNKK